MEETRERRRREERGGDERRGEETRGEGRRRAERGGDEMTSCSGNKSKVSPKPKPVDAEALL